MRKVVVEIQLASTEVAAKKSSMGCENAGKVNLAGLQSDQTYTSLPLVEMG